jgi:hypothetical protein
VQRRIEPAQPPLLKDWIAAVAAEILIRARH